MLLRLGYFSGQVAGRMNLETHKALAEFQADKDLIATGDLNYDVYSRLLQEIKGYPVNGRAHSVNNQTGAQNTGKPKREAPAGRHLSLVSTKAGYRVNDIFVVKLKSNRSGYLYCFHQSGSGDVVQILPKEPNVQLQIPRNYSRNLPDSNDGFLLKFESKNKAERIMCILQNLTAGTVSPFAGKFETFAALPVDRLEDIPSKFAQFGGLKDQIMISKATHQ